MSPPERLEPCRVLGVDPDCDRAELKAAYRYLSKKYHPDSSGNSATSERFALVVRAYKVLDVRAKRAPPRPIWGRLEGEDDLFALGSLAMAGPDPEIRRAAVRRLGFTGKKAAYVFLRRALADGDEGVAAAAIRAVADLSAFQAAGELAALWLRASAALRGTMLDVAEATAEPVFRQTLRMAATEAGPLGRRARRLLGSFPE